MLLGPPKLHTFGVVLIHFLALNRMHLRITLLTLLLMVVLSVNAQTDLTFSAINSTDGISDNRIRNIVQLKDGRLIITTEGGTTNLFNGTSFKIIHQKSNVSCSLSGYSGFLHGYVDKEHVWIKNQGKLKLLEVAMEQFVPNPDSVLKTLDILEPPADFFMDVQGGYWIRTLSDKLMYRSAHAEKPMVFGQNISTPYGLQDALLDLAVIQDQVFLVYRSGLMICYDLRTQKALYKTNSLSPAERAQYDYTLMIAQSDEELYMLRNGKSSIMQRFDARHRRWSTMLKANYWLSTVSVDVDKNVWVSCATGLWRFDKKNGTKERYPTFKLVDGTDVTTEANTLFNDTQGGLWLGTFNHGLLYYHPDRFKFRYYGKSLFKVGQRDIEVQGFQSLAPNKVLIETSLGMYDFNPENGQLNHASGTPASVAKVVRPYKDHRGFLWTGTLDGLTVRCPKTDANQTLYTEDGLVNNCIKGIQEDGEGNMWISTACGVSRISVKVRDGKPTFTITNFNQYDGVIKNEFITNSIVESKEGLLFIGGVNEFNVLDLKRPWLLRELQKPLFTDFSLFGTPIQTGVNYQGKVLLTKSLAATDKIVLNHRQNSVSIRFSALNYVNPTQTYYQYRLSGVDDQWHSIFEPNGTGSASYSNLAPGTYVFMVKAANNSNEWGLEVASLTLEIRPPFWRTPWAYLIYMVLVVFLAYVVIASVRTQTQRKLAKRNEEKLNELKFKFFTNISHEFRTPLTLIITPLEALLQEIKGTPFEQKLRSVYKHSIDLMQLVNQLLDFRRLELGGEKLHLTYGNISEFLQQFVPMFEKLAQLKQIDFSVETPEADDFLYFDNAKLHKVINNLLSNAFKFTPAGGEIKVVSYKLAERFFIEVVDSGVGIPKNELPMIFNRYFQGSNAQEGSGIGLHLVKEYVVLHQGSIVVESESGVKTVFRLELPMSLGPISAETKEAISMDSTEPVERKAEMTAHTLLVVEDNEELRNFLVTELRKSYQVLEAANGLEAQKLALAESPDLIVSDVMMPIMDGLELCKHVKSDLRTSHIPVILLTAKVSEEQKLSGFQSGADEYLAKPFSLEMLLLRVQQLIEQQEKRKVSFSGKIEVNPSEITISSLDEQLLQKALDAVERNMGNPEYSVQQLSQELGMDRSVLYKKLQSLTDLSPLEFIRSLRLKRAAQLLMQGGYPVAEVAEMVGFNTQKYFSKYFKDAFGVLPSQYAQQSRKGL
jgi:signal transduction histidine kinase/DNA-binding response OmpR family regulator